VNEGVGTFARRRGFLNWAVGKILVFALASLMAAIPSTTHANAEEPLPTISQVEALVSASTSITSIPSDLTPMISMIHADGPSSVLPGAGGCFRTANPCLFGATHSSRTIVLMGDSHALMWSPAIAEVASKLGYQLVLMWSAGCALVSTPDKPSCMTFKAQAISRIFQLRPKFVILAERSTGTELSLTDAQWTSSLKTFFAQIRAHGPKLVMIGDNPILPANPDSCLARFPTAVQTCAGRLTTSGGQPTTRENDEAAASRALNGVTFVDPTPWLCSATCSPIIGNMVAYYDQSHISGSYSAFLSGAMNSTLTPLLMSH